MQKYVWISPSGERIPCSIKRSTKDGFVIRTADPYDPGEHEFEVPHDEVEPNFPRATHTFVHSSMYGSYVTGCHVVRDLPNDRKVIAYWDSIIEEGTEQTVDAKDLKLIDTRSSAEAAWELAFQGYMYGEDETANARSWFLKGYEAGARS